MPYETIIVDDRDQAVAITLNRPDALNSISPAMIDDLNIALDGIEGRTHLCALSITGNGRAFCAGADLKAAKERMAGADAATVNSQFLDALRHLLLRIEGFPAPVIAAVNGLALAGGMELLLACDLVLAAESAKLGDAHANYGLVPGGGSSVRLPRKIGPTRAKQLIFTGAFLPARQMLDWGLVNQVVPDDGLQAAVDELIATLAARSPVGLRRMKRMIDDGQEQSLEAALRYELALNAQHAASHDRTEGLAAFAEKRKPIFKGH
ncbi:MAG: enoyl-CoA hydratase/isomerase family protein [Rhodospirillaceae bacterium]|jgi:enoyl-CoA hydratase|nr:enoyl-CoA hydratase/isomerase family protein [Rhodospirillaceae bacterium]MBT5192151.1 enoyl-CoA hydratase/isomerase family protein [Rhodospirillaceae bacterium]MBT5896270.1 enoyl-CoA hydratase/isomerase family protein [Rhodospirillaceae bacterium]MBT6428249.1 enoyl-CoA hydratase/isomerase family protein [Rhodospirillaceae bacterium]